MGHIGLLQVPVYAGPPVRFGSGLILLENFRRKELFTYRNGYRHAFYS